MSQVYVAFYQRKELITSFKSFLHHAQHEMICLLTGSRFSHCEIAVLLDDGRYRCYSSSGRDDGVREKTMPLPTTRWQLVPVCTKNSHEINDFYLCHQQKKYDYLGALRGVFSFIPEQKDRWYCSEYCSAALGLSKIAGRSPQTLFKVLTLFTFPKEDKHD